MHSAIEALALGIAAKMDARVAAVLPRIEGAGSKLLALRSYLRSGGHLAERWSWTQEQIAAYEGSIEQQELNAEIQRVARNVRASESRLRIVREPAGAQSRHPACELESQRIRCRGFGSAAAGRRCASRHRGDRCLARHSDARIVPEVVLPGADSNRCRAWPVASWQMRAIDFQVHLGARSSPDPTRARSVPSGSRVAGLPGSTWRCARRAASSSGRSSRRASPGITPTPRSPSPTRSSTAACRALASCRFDPRRRSATMRAYSFIRN